MKSSVLSLLEQGKYVKAREEIMGLNIVDIAQFIEEFEEEHILILFRLLPKEIASNVFTYLSVEQQQYIIEGITDRETQNIIRDLFLDDTVDMLEEMPANIVQKILNNTSENKRKLINKFLKYPENSAGSLMTVEYVSLKKEMTASEAISHIRKTGVDKETIDICYVTDKARKLEGIISLRTIILSKQDVVIGDIMYTNIISISTQDDQEDIANLFKKYDFIAMPVVDHENRLVGIITIDDIVDIIEQENTEDFQRMAAMAPSEEEYLKTGIFTLSKHRITWLLVLMVSATFTGRIMGRFENVLQSVIVLSTFIPMLMDTGGNAGSQSATLVIRGLALDEIKLTDMLKVFWKELRVSIIVGFALASVNFVRLFLIEKVDSLVNVTVCVSLFITVVLAKVVGGILPIIAKKLKLDPAIMAGPLITTIVDAVALLAYFSLASGLLGI
ncbi:MAG TPA: magnesium transporter [Clostridiales bacterium]|nr:magnesium transporter [Clostridiales bacterium]